MQTENSGTNPTSDPQGSASAEQNEEEEEDDSRTRKAKAPALAKVMGASKTVVDQLERETFDAQPRWLQELAEKRQSKLFPPKPTNMAASLLELADKLTSASEQQICRAAALDIEKAVTALHGQADGRVEGVLEEIHQKNSTDVIFVRKEYTKPRSSSEVEIRGFFMLQNIDLLGLL